MIEFAKKIPKGQKGKRKRVYTETKSIGYDYASHWFINQIEGYLKFRKKHDIKESLIMTLKSV